MAGSNTGAAINGVPVEFLYEDNSLKWTKTLDTNEGAQDEDEGAILERDVLAITSLSYVRPLYKVYTLGIIDSPSNAALPVPDVEMRQTQLRDPPYEFISKHLVKDARPPHLSLPANNIHVVISSRSGTGKAEAFFNDILQPYLKVLGIYKGDYQIVPTVSHETIRHLAETTLRDKASKGVRQTVLLLSGDGGVVELLNGLVGAEVSGTYKRPTIALFPFGTGNALFHSIHQQPMSPNGTAVPPKTPLLLALNALLSRKSQPLPYFCASFSSATLLTNEGRTATPIPNNELHGCIVASYGFHSTLVADSDTAELRKHGDKRFQIVAQDLLANPHRYRARLTLTEPRSRTNKEVDYSTSPDRKTSHEEIVVDRETHAYILCTLVSNLEKTFTISPKTTPLDSQMRVVHFDSGDGSEIMGVMKDAYDDGKHVDRGDGFVSYEEVDAMRIDFMDTAVGGNEGKWLRVCIDGLIVRVEEGGWMKVKKLAKGLELLDIALC